MESPFATIALHPFLFARISPSFIDIASAIVADATLDRYLLDAAMKWP
jgi:hypothetical protein